MPDDKKNVGGGQPTPAPEGFAPVNLNIKTSHICGTRVEQCCNYEITGRGPFTLQLPPVTHRVMTALRDTNVE
jgi:hypothetical protein